MTASEPNTGVRTYSAAEIQKGALVPLSHDERMAIALEHGQLRGGAAQGCMLWFFVVGAIATGYLWSNWWLSPAYFVCALVLTGVHYGCKTWCIVTMHRRPMWFWVNSFGYAASDILLIGGTLAIVGFGVVRKWF